MIFERKTSSRLSSLLMDFAGRNHRTRLVFARQRGFEGSEDGWQLYNTIMDDGRPSRSEQPPWYGRKLKKRDLGLAARILSLANISKCEYVLGSSSSSSSRRLTDQKCRMNKVKFQKRQSKSRENDS